MYKAVKILPILCISFLLASCSSSLRFNSAGKVHKGTGSGIVKQDKKTPNRLYYGNELNRSELSGQILSEAEKWIGVPYSYGGESKSGTDCSGFVLNIFKAVGIILPRTAHQQWQFAVPISNSDLRPGDLVFFSSGGKVDHVGIYVGNDQMIHASSSRGVIITDLSENYYESRKRSYGRIDGIN